MTVKSKASAANGDIAGLLRARNPLIWVQSVEWARVERALIDIAASANFEPRFVDVAAGITDATGRPLMQSGDPQACLDFIANDTRRAVYILRDFHAFLDPVTVAKMKNTIRAIRTADASTTRAMVVLSPKNEIPVEIGRIPTVQYPLPERPEILRSLADFVAVLPETSKSAGNIRANVTAMLETPGTRDAVVDATIGLTLQEAENAFAKSMVSAGKLDVALIGAEKKRVISGVPGLTWYDPDPRGLDGIGGLDALKSWLCSRKVAFSAKARAFGLPSPKGLVLVGPPGTGKSLTAKCIATAFGVPLIRVDLGGAKSKYVGESEQNIRRALEIAEACAPCVLWCDEIEKALAGATGQQGDGGVSTDQLGTLLSFMQETKAPIFVVATANDVSSLPPELLRKGRFDEIFFVDLPNASEREACVKVTLATYGRDVSTVDCTEVARATAGFTGAEIAALVPDALFTAYADNERALTTSDLTNAASNTVPLSKTAGEKIDALRQWAKGRARPASTVEVANTRGPMFDL